MANERRSDAVASSSASALLISASDKAGMQGIDRERVNEILLRESGNSLFMQRQRRMDENTDTKIAELKRTLYEKDLGCDEWRQQLLKQSVDPLLEEFQRKRNPLSSCVVIDMDGFFISCHILDQPHLANIPACVGGSSMISTSNYVARKYGVRAAMPGYLGSKLVDELSGGKETLTFVKNDFQLYKTKSAEVKTVLEEYDPNLKMYSLDEAYMNIKPYLCILLSKNGMSHDDVRSVLKDSEVTANIVAKYSAHGCDFHIAAQSLLHSIRRKIKDDTGLSASAGLASNYLIAKVASDINKPDGQHFVGPSEKEIRDFVNPLPSRKIHGIGRVLEKTLRGVLGIETVQDIYNHRADIFQLFKHASAHFLMRASIGYADSGTYHENIEGDGHDKDSDEDLNRKGISHERTFSPVTGYSELCSKLQSIALGLVHDLKERNLRPKTITLKVKLSNFDVISKTTSRDFALFQPGNFDTSSRDLVDTAETLLKEAMKSHSQDISSGDSFSVRLLGLRCSNFQLEKDTQVSLSHYLKSRTTIPDRNQLSIENTPQHYDSPARINPYQSSPKKEVDYEQHRIPSSLEPRSSDSFNNLVDFFQCPICSIPLSTSDVDNHDTNAHVDACLNKSLVKKLSREETDESTTRTRKKKRRLSDFFKS